MNGHHVLFLQAVFAGFAVTAPPGPVGAICVGRTLRWGLPAGMASALGAAGGDALLALVAAIGLEVVLGGAHAFGRIVALVAAPVLVFIGIRLMLRARRAGAPLPTDAEVLGDPCAGSLVARHCAHGLSTFLLAVSTPLTVPALVSLYSVLGITGGSALGVAGICVIAVGAFSGAMVWWLIVCPLAHLARERATGWLRAFDFVSGALLIVAAVMAVRAGLS